MTVGLRLPAAWQTQLRALADAAYPAEACGLILGRPGVADQLVPCANVAAEPHRHFEVDPAEIFRCYKAVRGTGRAVLAVYHSHPQGPARPSATDAGRAWDKELLWLLIDGGGGRAGAISGWRPTGDGFAPAELTWEET
jgi:proteasome lid subunit RPN8/RPN11